MELNKVCEFIIDCPHSTAVDEGEGYPLIRTPNIGKGNLILDGVHRVSEKVYLERNARGTPQDGDLIFAREAPAGNVAVIKNGEKVCLGQRTVLIRPKLQQVNPVYLAYYLLSPEQQYKLVGSANGSTVAHINLPTIRNLRINLPSTNIQNRIAKVLSAYDDLIELNTKKVSLLERLAEDIYKEWFVHFRFPGYEAATFVEKRPFGWIVSICENPKIPSCFEYCEFGEIGSFVRGRNITAAEMVNGEIPVISAGLQPSGYHNQANVKGRSLTISASGANAGYLQYNLTDIWAADCSYYQNDNNLWFVYCTLKFLQPVISNLQCGAAQPHVYPKNINKLCVLKPTDELIVKFNQTVEPFFDEIETLKKKNDNLIKQRDLLLPRLMSGKLEV